MKVSIKTICPLLLFIFIAYKYEFELIDKAYKDGFLLMLVIVLLIFIVGLKHRKLEKIKKTNLTVFSTMPCWIEQHNGFSVSDGSEACFISMGGGTICLPW